MFHTRQITQIYDGKDNETNVDVTHSIERDDGIEIRQYNVHNECVEIIAMPKEQALLVGRALVAMCEEEKKEEKPSQTLRLDMLDWVPTDDEAGHEARGKLRALKTTFRDFTLYVYPDGDECSRRPFYKVMRPGNPTWVEQIANVMDGQLGAIAYVNDIIKAEESEETRKRG